MLPVVVKLVDPKFAVCPVPVDVNPAPKLSNPDTVSAPLTKNDVVVAMIDVAQFSINCGVVIVALAEAFTTAVADVTLHAALAFTFTFVPLIVTGCGLVIVIPLALN